MIYLVLIILTFTINVFSRNNTRSARKLLYNEKRQDFYKVAAPKAGNKYIIKRKHYLIKNCQISQFLKGLKKNQVKI